VADASDVGRVIDTVDFPVEEGKLREWAVAVGSDDHTAVPITFSAVAGHWRDQAAMVEELRLDIRRIVVGGVEWEHHAPVAVGDRLHGSRVVTAVETKERGTGVMTLITLETRLSRGDDELVVVQRDTVIELPARS
jgi:hypothetical protein